ncbi:SH3 domain-containing protein [Streptomyces sp. NPDC005355]|uniref:SH3 domain-containing protein n=1 Tax=Streptomyces sp. NPDC005355 TaxID=3157038 RepID=UPI0033BC4FB2
MITHLAGRMSVLGRARLASLAAAVLVIPMGMVVGSGGTASAYATCGRTASDLDSSSWPNQTAGVSANMRTGSLTSCAITGYADNQDKLDYHCYTSNGSSTWTYLRNDHDGTYGWVNDSLLPGNGSNVYCGF